MANNSYAKSNKKSNTALFISIVSVFLALILCGVIIAGLFLGWFTKKGEEPVQESGGMEITDGESNGISVLSSKIDPSQYATYGISDTAESAELLTATVTPENAVDAELDWTVSFSNATSEWATGKTVTDYVAVKPTSDGALTATVACYGAFGEQITVKASIRTNSDVYATCAVDYRQKFLGFSSIKVTEQKSGTTLIQCDSGTTTVNMVVVDDISGLIGSVNGEVSLSETYTLAAEVGNVGLTMTPTFRYTQIVADVGFSTQTEAVVGDGHLICYDLLLFNNSSIIEENRSDVILPYKRMLSENSETAMLVLTADVTVNGAAQTHSWDVYLSVTDTFAATITFDTDGIEFGG